MYSSAAFFTTDSAASLAALLLYKAALTLALLRWLSSWALRLRSPSAQSPPSISSQSIRDNLLLSAFSDISHRLPATCDTCAVCLAALGPHDQVRELRNCPHVFHRDCIDRWVDHDRCNHNTCPLCRAPLLTPSQSLAWPTPEPSWAVERLLYLFGDDLLAC